jgi:uncharacterized membrane protein
MNSYSSRQRTGFILAAIVAFSNLPGAFVPTGDDDGGGPPIGILIFGAVAALLILGLLYRAWRSESEGSLRVAAGLMIVVALTAVPAFFVSDVPAAVRLFAGLYILGTIVSVVLMFSPARRPVPVLD